MKMTRENFGSLSMFADRSNIMMIGPEMYKRCMLADNSFGTEADTLLEELSELQQAVHKLKRAERVRYTTPRRPKTSVDSNFIEECGDTILILFKLIELFSYMRGSTFDDVYWEICKGIDFKLRRDFQNKDAES